MSFVYFENILSENLFGKTPTQTTPQIPQNNDNNRLVPVES